jgi:hypothetical protein
MFIFVLYLYSSLTTVYARHKQNLPINDVLLYTVFRAPSVDHSPVLWLFMAVLQLWLLSAGFPPHQPGFSLVGHSVDRASLGQVSSEYFGSPATPSSH